VADRSVKPLPGDGESVPQRGAGLSASRLLINGGAFGEQIGIHWGDLELHGRFIGVKRQWTRGEEAPIEGGNMRRVSEELFRELQQPRENRRVEVMVQGGNETQKSRSFGTATVDTRNRSLRAQARASEVSAARLDRASP
jgi:hypothetical protein